MQKLKLWDVFVILFMVIPIFSVVYGGSGGNVWSRSRSRTSAAILTLQREGLNEKSVQAFKATIQNINAKLATEKTNRGGLSGRIENQIAENEDIVCIVDELAKYSEKPTEPMAVYLRSVARTNSMVQELIIYFMDQQTDNQFRFEFSKHALRKH